MRSPAVIIVGEVVRLRERLQWFEQEESQKNGLQHALVVANLETEAHEVILN